METSRTSISCKMHPLDGRGVGSVGRFAGIIALLLLLAFVSVSVQTSFAAGPRRMHPAETQTGLASWYGADQGRHTASGERFDPHAMTAAHRHLPFGTLVRVTNQLNGKSVDLRINDRGPWRHNRIIDVTEAAADVLDMKKQGTVPVTVLVLQLGMPTKQAHAGD
jgi:rare lipoprotein A